MKCWTLLCVKLLNRLILSCSMDMVKLLRWTGTQVTCQRDSFSGNDRLRQTARLADQRLD